MIVLTEPGVLYQMRIKAPKSKFYDVPSIEAGCIGCSKCPYMRLNTLEKLYQCMKHKAPEITVSKDIAAKAKVALDAMLSFG